MTISAIIEARMNSSRLPGKVMLPVLDEPLIGHLIKRLKKVPSLDNIVIATSINKKDDIIEDYANKNSIKVFRGSELNVLERVTKAAINFNVKTIVSISGDCPLIDPEIIEQTINIFKFNKVDYVSNSFYSSYPDGMDTQVFNIDSLIKTLENTDDPLDKEHVTRYIVNNPNLFSHFYLIAPPSLYWPKLGLIVDEEQDFNFVKALIENLNKKNKIFSCREILDFLKTHPKFLKLNDKVTRNNNRPLL